MAVFTSSMGMPLRPNLTIVCTALLQECPRELLHRLHLFHPRGEYESILPIQWPLATSACAEQDLLLGGSPGNEMVPGPGGASCRAGFLNLPSRSSICCITSCMLLRAEKMIPVCIWRRYGQSWWGHHEKTSPEMVWERQQSRGKGAEDEHALF